MLEPKSGSMKSNAVFLIVLSLFALSWAACSEDDNTNDDDIDVVKGELRLQLTDAPIDDSRIAATFITISEIRLDGQPLDGFTESTIDVYALQDGRLELLVDVEIESRIYETLELDLNYATDADGNSPGCYVLDSDGDKHPLGSGEQTLSLGPDLDVKPEAGSIYIIDFDLRKCIERSTGASDYQFAGTGELEAGVRVVNRYNVGAIFGNCEDNFSSSDRIIVYAYTEGSYNRSDEIQQQNGRAFANAENSTRVESDGTYELFLLEEGSYELIFASYEENSEGEMELKGTLELDILSSLNDNIVTVNARSSVSLDVLVTGIIGL